MHDKPRILILCTGNSARSQMAEGIFRRLFGENFRVDSAGTRPSIVRPEAIVALDEVGIDISRNRSKSVDEFADAEIDYVVTVCDNAKENCPYFPAKTKLIHHAFDDPAEAAGDFDTRLAEFRRVRDLITDYAETVFPKIIEENQR